MPGLWSERNCGYKLGLLSFGCGFVLFAIGFAAPYWIVSPGYASQIMSGLWVTCLGSSDVAGEYGPSLTCRLGDTFFSYSSAKSGSDWWLGVLVLQSLAFAMFLAGSLNCCIANRCLGSTSCPRFLEIALAAGGVVGFVSLMVFVGKTPNHSHLYSWAFALDLLGCIVVVIASVVLFLYNSPEKLDKAEYRITPGSDTAHFTAQPPAVAI